MDRTSAAARVDRLCLVKPCKVIATYDSATPRLQVIENTQ